MISEITGKRWKPSRSNMIKPFMVLKISIAIKSYYPICSNLERCLNNIVPEHIAYYRVPRLSAPCGMWRGGKRKTVLEAIASI